MQSSNQVLGQTFCYRNCRCLHLVKQLFFVFFVIADPKRGSFIYNPCRYNIFSLIPCPRMPSKHIPIVNVWYQEWEDIFNLLFSGLSYVYVNQPKGRTLLFSPQSRQRLTCFPADRPEDSLRWSLCADCVVAFFFFSSTLYRKSSGHLAETGTAGKQ